MGLLDEALVLIGGAIGWGAFCLLLGIAVGDLRVGAIIFVAITGAVALLLSLASLD